MDLSFSLSAHSISFETVVEVMKYFSYHLLVLQEESNLN